MTAATAEDHLLEEAIPDHFPPAHQVVDPQADTQEALRQVQLEAQEEAQIAVTMAVAMGVSPVGAARVPVSLALARAPAPEAVESDVLGSEWVLTFRLFDVRHKEGLDEEAHNTDDNDRQY